MSIESGILEEFAVEANELLDDAEDALVKIDQSNDLKGIYDLVFRSFHSLKGSSGMLGFEELQRHMHLVEDYLQKSKEDLDSFKSSADYYLNGIDAARKILKGEVVQFVYEVYKEKKAAASPDVLNLKKRKVVYLSDSTVKPLGKEILALEKVHDFFLKFSKREDLKEESLASEDYDVLVSDLNLDILLKMIPAKKLKNPIVLVVDDISKETKIQNIFQVLKKGDEPLRIDLAMKSALEAKLNIELFEKAKGLLMYMYSDLEEYLIEKNKVDIQRALSTEVRSFIKSYTR